MKKKLSITRRDFINGVSYGLAASVAPIDFLKAKFDDLQKQISENKQKQKDS